MDSRERLFRGTANRAVKSPDFLVGGGRQARASSALVKPLQGEAEERQGISVAASRSQQCLIQAHVSMAIEDKSRRSGRASHYLRQHFRARRGHIKSCAAINRTKLARVASNTESENSSSSWSTTSRS